MFADAEAYQRFMGRWSSILAPLLVDFTNLPDRGQVLDVGSGTGALAFAIAKLRVHCQVMGIDPSKEYVGVPEVSLLVAAVTTTVLGTIGLLAGWFPAREASRLDPVVAMKM